MHTFALVLLRHFPVLQIPVTHDGVNDDDAGGGDGVGDNDGGGGDVLSIPASRVLMKNSFCSLAMPCVSPRPPVLTLLASPMSD